MSGRSRVARHLLIRTDRQKIAAKNPVFRCLEALNEGDAAGAAHPLEQPGTIPGANRTTLATWPCTRRSSIARWGPNEAPSAPQPSSRRWVLASAFAAHAILDERRSDPNRRSLITADAVGDCGEGGRRPVGSAHRRGGRFLLRSAWGPADRSGQRSGRTLSTAVCEGR